MENIKLCEYGCNEKANFQLKNRKWCCCQQPSGCKAVRSRNSEGLKKAHQDGRVESFSNEARERSLKTRKKESLDFFLANPELFYNSESLKRHLLE